MLANRKYTLWILNTGMRANLKYMTQRGILMEAPLFVLLMIIINLFRPLSPRVHYTDCYFDLRVVLTSGVLFDSRNQGHFNFRLVSLDSVVPSGVEIGNQTKLLVVIGSHRGHRRHVVVVVVVVD
jgi:hypothetical protein